jgi:hypothetical protein
MQLKEVIKSVVGEMKNENDENEASESDKD